MRFSISADTSAGRPFLTPRHVVSAATMLMTPAIGISGAFAQSIDTDPDDAGYDHKIQEITVTGVRSIVNDKLGGRVQDTPQSINVIPAKTLQQESVTRLTDALKNVPGITLNAGEGAARGDTVNLRGFPAFDDFYLDGIRDAAVYTRDSFDLEDLEVLKGPSAILFGRGSTGGVINQVSKAPTLSGFDTVVLQGGTNDSLRATADLDAALGPSSAIRLNAMGERSEVTDRDNDLNRRYGFAPSIAFGIGKPTSVVFSFLHQSEDNRPDVGIPFLNGRPAPVPRNFDYGLSSDYFTTSVNVGTLRIRHEFNDDIAITDTGRFGIYDFNDHNNAPNYGKTVPGPNTPLGSILVGRDAPASSGTETDLTDQLDLTAQFRTGFLAHSVTAGIEVGRETNDLDRYNNPFNNTNNWIPETPLLNPNSSEGQPAEPVTSLQRTTADIAAAYALDTVHIGKYVDVIGGVRFDRFSAHFNQYTLTTKTTLDLQHVDEVASPRAAIVFKPTANQRYYFSYGTSFDPSAEALSLTAKTANLGPVKAKSYEFGAKTDWLHRKLSVTAALFRTEVENAQTNDPDDPAVTVLAGDQRVNGFELVVQGHLTKKWEILAGYTYLDAKTIAYGTQADVGKFLMNAARNAANLWTEYYLTDKWEIGTGGNFLGKRYADIGNTAILPSYVVWNGMVSYRLNDHLNLQVNGTNLLDKIYYENSYFSSAGENHVIPGPGRTVTFTVRTSF